MIKKCLGMAAFVISMLFVVTLKAETTGITSTPASTSDTIAVATQQSAATPVTTSTSSAASAAPAATTVAATAEPSAPSVEVPTKPHKSRVQGIYLTQYTLENTAFLNYLIKHAKAAGIDTFVVDLELFSKRYDKNIQLLKENNIHYVARIIMFPNGGGAAVIKDPNFWQKKYRLVQKAVDLGASQIQLDYIRYSTKQRASSSNSQDILKILQWYKNKLASQNVPLQIDVFGETSFGESKHIGQNIKLFSQSVDAICPMVYPSHYVPFQKHFKQPYETVFGSLQSIKKQFGTAEVPMKIYAYIELTNYHYPMSHTKTLAYIRAQIRAVEHAGVHGWYAWSPHNRYDNLFKILSEERQNPDKYQQPIVEKSVTTAQNDDDEVIPTKSVTKTAPKAAPTSTTTTTTTKTPTVSTPEVKIPAAAPVSIPRSKAPVTYSAAAPVATAIRVD